MKRRKWSTDLQCWEDNVISKISNILSDDMTSEYFHTSLHQSTLSKVCICLSQADHPTPHPQHPFLLPSPAALGMWPKGISVVESLSRQSCTWIFWTSLLLPMPLDGGLDSIKFWWDYQHLVLGSTSIRQVFHFLQWTHYVCTNKTFSISWYSHGMHTSLKMYNNDNRTRSRTSIIYNIYIIIRGTIHHCYQYYHHHQHIQWYTALAWATAWSSTDHNSQLDDQNYRHSFCWAEHSQVAHLSVFFPKNCKRKEMTFLKRRFRLLL